MSESTVLSLTWPNPTHHTYGLCCSFLADSKNVNRVFFLLPPSGKSDQILQAIEKNWLTVSLQIQNLHSSSCRQISFSFFNVSAPAQQKSCQTLWLWPVSKHITWALVGRKYQHFSSVCWPAFTYKSTTIWHMPPPIKSLVVFLPAVVLNHWVNLDSLTKWDNDGNIFLEPFVSAKFTLNT